MMSDPFRVELTARVLLTLGQSHLSATALANSLLDSIEPMIRADERLRHPTRYDGETMFKVYDALTRAGLTERQIIDTVHDIQSSGVFFREM